MKTKTLKLSSAKGGCASGENSKTLPVHVAIIVDGNRRWAEKRGLPLGAGHQKATDETIEALTFHSMKRGIKYLTFWAFSTENWKRGQRFAGMLWRILENKMAKGVQKYNQAGIRLKIIGDLSKLPKSLVRTLKQWEQESAQNNKITVVIALNYGGREEILRAVNKASKKQKAKSKKLESKDLVKHLDTVGMPDPDLIVRTGGEKRLSGFMSWQNAYSELYFTDTFFPDFTPKKLDEAIIDFQQRKRNFGS